MRKQTWVNSVIVIIFMLMFFSWVNIVRADGAYSGEYIENYDSDSIKLKVWLWPGTARDTGNYALENMRLYGVDTPEKGWRAGCAAEQQLSIDATFYVTKLLSEAAIITIDVRPTRGKFGRPLIIIYLPQENGTIVSLADLLIEKEYARPFFGKGKRSSWCEDEDTDFFN